MDDTSSQHGDVKQPKYAAPKDKNCPYCGQAFTSSSLGRHLDLYIKERNPKPPDGIHNVDEIRKMRGGITRRQPRGSIGTRRDSSTPSGTPRGGSVSRKPSMTQDRDVWRYVGIPKDGQYNVDSGATSKYPFPSARWEVTGVMNDINDAVSDPGRRPPGMQRQVSKQLAHKAQFDVKHKLADAMDTARAAELALREVLSSWRAAKQQLDANSMLFDFDPLSLDFPSLTLQCLKPPPTLFSSTPNPTSTSWAVQTPGRREFGALQTYFQEQFRHRKAACLATTTDAVEELTCPAINGPYRDKSQVVKRAEKSTENLEKQVNEHLQSAFLVWETLPPERQGELWKLELARSVGRRNKEMEKLKEEQHKLQQENANLKLQIEQLNRLQQPREFSMLSPTTIPFDRDFISHAYEQGVKGASLVGFSLDDQQLDLGTLVTRSIERWKSVVTTNRVSGGMSAQRPLDQTDANSIASHAVPRRSQTQTPQQTMPHHPPKRLSNASIGGLMSEQTPQSSNNTAAPSIDETSDQDADAEMEDDDSFAMINAASPQKQPIAPPIQDQATLQVPRTRGHMNHHQHQQHQQQQHQQQQHQQQQHQQQQHQQQQHQQQQRAMQDQRFMMQNGAMQNGGMQNGNGMQNTNGLQGANGMQNGTGSPVTRAAMSISRSMPNMNIQMQANPGLVPTDMGMAMQGMRPDGMYME